MSETDKGIYAQGEGTLAHIVDGTSNGAMQAAGLRARGRRQRLGGHMEAASRGGALGVGVQERVVVRFGSGAPSRPPPRRR